MLFLMGVLNDLCDHSFNEEYGNDDYYVDDSNNSYVISINCYIVSINCLETVENINIKLSEAVLIYSDNDASVMSFCCHLRCKFMSTRFFIGSDINASCQYSTVYKNVTGNSEQHIQKS